MAEIIPALNEGTLRRMTSGEKRVARRLESLLEDDYLVWYDIPVGKTRRYPDFIVLHPSRGLLFLEVKDWKPDTLKSINKSSVTLQTGQGRVTQANPFEQVRQYAYTAISALRSDKSLCHTTGTHQGKLIMPYGCGVVFTNISRRQIEKAIPNEYREKLLPDHLMIYRDEITESADVEVFQKQLWDMFTYQFGGTLTLPQIDRIRWHLFPEIRIGVDGQGDLFAADDSEHKAEQTLPDIIKIMDIQQEQLARSLGEGHRVIHGVAGSGKPLILGYRCQYLARLMSKPILVLCFNVTLAAQLCSFIESKGIRDQVEVCHFHDWCARQLKTYHVAVTDSDKPYWERQVDTVIDAVDKGHIPRAQYGALLIDEGHDFAAEWLKLVVQMIDPKSNSLLLLYDDAQSIYRKKNLDFSLASVGIQAQGRTTILRLNYRNTREILHFAYSFASHYLDLKKHCDDQLAILDPQAAGNSGPRPLMQSFPSFNDEMKHALDRLEEWHKLGLKWGAMAVIYIEGHLGRNIATAMRDRGIPHNWLGSKQYKMAYSSSSNRVTILTAHSSKGLEFSHVILFGVGQMNDAQDPQRDARLLYVGMTRAQHCLVVSASAENNYTQKMMAIRAA